jgi:hypothetical protein
MFAMLCLIKIKNKVSIDLILLTNHTHIEIDITKDINITTSFLHESSSFVRKSKKTLLIFRRMSDRKAKCNLELRHQRTCDVCFDWAKTTDTKLNDMVNNDSIDRTDKFKPFNYLYKMIETMLPKAMIDENNRHLRLMEV